MVVRIAGKQMYLWRVVDHEGEARSGKMSRDMRSSARNPTNAAATTIVNSEIGRRNANDTRFIVPPQPAAARTTERA
jgi:transposase-like protein